MNWLDPGFAVVPCVQFDGNARIVGEVDPVHAKRAYHRAYYHAVYKEKRRAYYLRTKDRDRAKKTAAANRRYWNAPEVARQKARDRLRLKYATDPDYRARVLAKSAKRRAMLKESA